MAVQLEGGFLSMNGSEYDISIYNDSYASSSTTIVIKSLKITYESEGDPFLEPLKASRCQVEFINNSAAVDTFITALVNGDEDQFKIKVEKEGDMFWCGVLLADQFSFEDKPKNRVVTLNAIDGIGRLRDLRFDWALDSGNPDQNTYLEYIYECLEYNGLSDFWGAGVAYFKESAEIYDTNMTNTGNQYSPLLQTRCDKARFLTDEMYTNVRNLKPFGKKATLPDDAAINCYEVLERILKLMTCRMFISDGVYYIQQLRNFNTSSYNERSIRKDLAVLSYQTVTHRLTEATDVKRLGDCRWTYFPPLQEVSIINEPLYTLAQSGGGIQQLTTVTEPLTQSIKLGTLTGGTSSGKSMRLRVAFNVPFNGSSLPTLMQVEIKFTAGAYRLKSQNAKPDIVEWTTNSGDVVRRQFTYRDLAKTSGMVYIDVITPEFPFASQTNCLLEVTWETIGTWSSANYINIYPVEITPLMNGLELSTTKYTVKNTTNNSVIIEYGELEFTDEQEITSKNIMEINSTGSTWVQSGVWDAGYSSPVSLAKTLCLETMSFQDRAVLTLQGSISVPKSYVGGGTPYVPMFHQTYYYDSETFIFNGGTLDCNLDKFTGEWFRSIQNKSGWGVQQDSGDGNAYNKDIKVGTPRENGFDPDKWTREAMYSLINKQLATVDTDIPNSGAITTISITSLDRKLYSGDVVSILHPVNNRVMDTFTLTADAAASDVELVVSSQTPTDDIPAGALVIFNAQTIRDSGIFRTTSSSTPPAGGFGGNGAIQVGLLDGILYYQSNGETYEVTGTLKT